MTVAPQQAGGSQGTADQAARDTEEAPLNQENAVPQRTLRLWEEVAHGIDKNSTGELVGRNSYAS